MKCKLGVMIFLLAAPCFASINHPARSSGHAAIFAKRVAMKEKMLPLSLRVKYITKKVVYSAKHTKNNRSAKQPNKL